MTRIHMQYMAEGIPDSRLPQGWADDLSHFSHTKRLFDYQQRALQNALKALWKYYEDFRNGQPHNADDTNRQRKMRLWQWYCDNGLSEDFSIEPKPAFADLLLNYYANYIHAQTGKISYEAFINRLNFWMATGSGKTVVIVKLIERLGRLVQGGEVPPCDILFLTHRNDLIEQLRRHVAEFNTSHNDTPIVLYELKDYAAARRERSSLSWEQGITVFYYRSDNLSDQQKEKILDFHNYDNDGKWFVLLDEAHKGDREDSKRQHIYSILSRNGFLFNFSATFTDPRDIATTVYNFNLAEYIRRGYGKHLLVLQPELSAFRDKPEGDSEAEKRKVVLKMLILLAYVRKVYEQKARPAGLYHRPLLLLLVNSVSTHDADLELFFRELEQIACRETKPDLWQAAKEELQQELEKRTAFLFEEDEKVSTDPAVWGSLVPEDICQRVFNASSHGEIEVLLRPSNRQEMAFKLKTADRPFALIRIGDISAWLKEKLTGYEIVERFDHESLFAGLNEDASDINLLLGSRSFYEGWDSNRPNVIGYINIGIGPDARKFILQSVGRGVRIEPIRNKRQRLLPLSNAGEIEANLFQRLKDAVQPLETVFIFGTNRQVLQTVLDSLRKEQAAIHKPPVSGSDHPQPKEHSRLTHVDKPADAPPAKRPLPARFEIAPEDFQALQSFVQGADNRVLLALTDATPTQVTTLHNALKQNRVFTIRGGPSGGLRRLLRRVVAYLGMLPEEEGGLKPLENEIAPADRGR